MSKRKNGILIKFSDLDYICPNCGGWLMSRGFRTDRAKYICSQCKLSISMTFAPGVGIYFPKAKQFVIVVIKFSILKM
jgi:predicted RNA-binding Zn-ribbon protein involved in translation (DUF1610 family)